MNCACIWFSYKFTEIQVLIFFQTTNNMIQALLKKFAFNTSLLYTCVMEKITARCPYNRIDQKVVLGRLPFRSMVQKLVEEENVRGVITLNEEYELERFAPSKEEWNSHGVRYLALPTVDFVACPSQPDLKRGVDFIREVDGSVYVHCKAGRTRSAALVACYLIQEGGMSPEQAVEFLAGRRSHVWLRDAQLEGISSYYDDIVKSPWFNNKNFE